MPSGREMGNREEFKNFSLARPQPGTREAGRRVNRTGTGEEQEQPA